VIPELPTPFDLVFIDADKQNYPNYLDAVAGRLRPGGLVIADNVLWSGKVLLPNNEQDEQTRALAEYARKVKQDGRFEQVMIPLRDGVSVARKR
jgi:caffeoyl-CoA O-methyltransferase